MKVLNGKPENRAKIPSDFLQDEKLSFEAKGVLSYLLANKQDDFNVSDLIKKSKNGRDASRNIINELIKHGYLIREYLRNSDGQYYGLKHDIYPSGRKCND